MLVSSKIFGSLILGVAWTLSISNAIAYRKDAPAWSLNKAQLAYEFSSVEHPKAGNPYLSYNSDQGPAYQTEESNVYRNQPQFVPLIQPPPVSRNPYSPPQPGQLRAYLSAPSPNSYIQSSGDSYANNKPTGLHTVYPFRPGQVLPAENEISSAKDTYGLPQSVASPTHYYGAPKNPSVKPPTGEYGTPNKAPADTYGLPNKAPSDTYGLPNKAPSDTYGLPQTQAVAPPSTSYGTPSNPPSSNYGPPTNAPSSNYGPPTTSYGVPTNAPSDSYGPPSEGGYSSPSSEGGYSSPPSSGEYGAPYPPPSEHREVRFLIHKAGDEEIVKDAVIEDAKWTGDKISFVHGPNLELKHHQKVYLPPQKKSIIYVLLKEPEIKTTIEVNEPAEAEQPKPEVFIIYQTGNGVIKKHYDLSPEEGSKVAQVLANKLRQARQTGKTENAAEKAEDAELEKIEQMLTSTAKPTTESDEAETTTQMDTVMCKSN